MLSQLRSCPFARWMSLTICAFTISIGCFSCSISASARSNEKFACPLACALAEREMVSCIEREVDRYAQNRREETRATPPQQ